MLKAENGNLAARDGGEKGIMDGNYPNLELAGLRWLAWEKHCVGVTNERNARPMMGDPDCLGITEHRYVIEIEVKRSVSDFHANNQKPHVRNRDLYLEKWPKQFYFLVPPDIQEIVLRRLPDYAGLMSVEVDNPWRLRVIKTAPVNKLSKKVSLKECANMMKGMRDRLVRAELKALQWEQRFVDGEWWTGESCDGNNYQI